MKAQIRKNNLGYNCGCEVCNKVQEGRKKQPFIIWYQNDGEKRGHNIPICSEECIQKKLLELAKAGA